MKKNQIVSISIFAIATITTFNSYAETAAAQLQVSATVKSSCSIAVENINFGEYNPTLDSVNTANGKINLTCVKGSAPIVSISGGNNNSGATRRLAKTTMDENNVEQKEYLTYGLYQPISNTADAGCPITEAEGRQWSSTTGITDSTVFSIPAATSSGMRSYKVCGFLAKGQDASAGIYTDTVTITASF